MTTTIEDNQLAEELQDFYLGTKQWLSDLELLNSEISFLKKLFERLFSPQVNTPDFGIVAGLLQQAAAVENKRHELSREIFLFLHRLEPLITSKAEGYCLELVESHARLEAEMEQLNSDFKTLNSTLFHYGQQLIHD